MQPWLIDTLQQKLQVVLGALIPGVRLQDASGPVPRPEEPWLWWQQTLGAPDALLSVGLSAAAAAEISTAVQQAGLLSAGTPEESANGLLRILANACASISPVPADAGGPARAVLERELSIFSLEFGADRRHIIAVGLSPALVRSIESQHLPEAGPALLHVDLPVSISLGRARLEFRDLVRLSAGSVVELDRMLGEPVDVTVNGSVVARGEIVVVEGNYGVRIQSVSNTGWRSGAGLQSGR